MSTGIVLPIALDEQIEQILADLYRETEAECVILADVSGHLISIQGELEGADPILIAALAAGNLAAIRELTRQIGEKNPHGSFLHEGESKSCYLFSVAHCFVLIVIFRSDNLIGLIRLSVRRAAERLYPLTAEFEEVMRQSTRALTSDFGATLVRELDNAFAGVIR